MALANISSRLLWLPSGGVRSVSVTFVPPARTAWTHIEVSIAWFGGVGAVRAYCEGYRYEHGDQAGNVIGASLTNGWLQDLVSATFTLVAEGNGYAAAVAKMTTWG
jgi:hypothetical protein